MASVLTVAMRGFWLYGWVWAVLLPGAAMAVPVISSIEVSPSASGDTVFIHASEPLTPSKTFALANPDRLVVDLPAVRVAAGNRAYRGTSVQSIRIGQFNTTTTRLVIDLSQPAQFSQVAPGNPLVIELAATGEVPAAPVAAVQETPVPNMHPAPASIPPNQPVTAAEKQALAAQNAPAGKKPLIAIDAGHGGQDPGATGLHNSHEKIITLNYAKALKKALLATGRYRVLLTREDDRYILLPERVNIARRAKADLFVSFHADSNPRPDARGLSIYTLSETASDAEAAALASRENKSDAISGIDLNTTDADVANILIDLTQRETMNKSSELADGIVTAMHGHGINTLEGTHRFAGFRVLKAPDIPSVLIELGFLTNATDERLLLTGEYRDNVVASVVKGIDHYRSVE